jgi:hypothetical protein
MAYKATVKRVVRRYGKSTVHIMKCTNTTCLKQSDVLYAARKNEEANLVRTTNLKTGYIVRANPVMLYIAGREL